MRIALTALFVVHLALAGLPAQQVGDANRNYTVNGNGSLAASYVTTNVAANTGSVDSTYQTSTPNAPVLWVAAPGGTPGWFQTATNSIDVGPAGLTFLLDGTGLVAPSAMTPYARTNGSGRFSLNITVNAALPATVYLTMAHFSPASPDGFFVAQAHRVNIVLDPSLANANTACNNNAGVQVLGDDTSAAVNLGFGFRFYGAVFNQAHISSNGSVCFGAADNTFTETVAQFDAGPARVAVFWDDLNPGAAGQVKFWTDNAATFEVCYIGVPEFPNVGANTFKATFANAVTMGAIYMDYDAAMTSNDGLVGITQGNNIVSNAINLSLGNNNLPNQNRGYYELFTAMNPVDIKGLQVFWVLDAGGSPTMQQ